MLFTIRTKHNSDQFFSLSFVYSGLFVKLHKYFSGIGKIFTYTEVSLNW